MKSTINFTSEQFVLNNRYILEDNLGKGKTAKVYKCIDIQTDETKAVKIYQNNDINEFENEEKILNKITDINSPYLIKCYESGKGILSYHGKNFEKMYTILELGNQGTLFDLILETEHGFSGDVCKFILLQILNAVDALHKEGICHRDIKPENIVLCGDNYDLKLCDFGYSAKFVDKNNQKKKLKKLRGTNYYAAPEILERKKYDGDKIDIFSIGALLFTLMTKKFAFEEATLNNIPLKIEINLYKLIVYKNYDKYWSFIEKYLNIRDLDENFKNLFLKLVAYNPEERPTIEEIKNHEWMQNVTNATPEYLNDLRNEMIREMAL